MTKLSFHLVNICQIVIHFLLVSVTLKLENTDRRKNSGSPNLENVKRSSTIKLDLKWL